MDDAQQGRWVDEPPLRELATPPPHLIQTHGAQLVRIYTIDDPDPRRHEGYTEALFLAWAPIPNSRDWAVLAAWLSAWQDGVRTTGKGRYGWLRIVMPADIESGRVRAVKPFVMDEDEWHGHHPLAEFSIAVRAAVASLPEGLRERAVRPRET